MQKIVRILIDALYFSVEMSGMGYGGLSGASSIPGVGGMGAMGTQGSVQNYQFVLQNLQALIAANPSFLTGGIPTKLISQLMESAKYLQNSYNVSLK